MSQSAPTEEQSVASASVAGDNHRDEQAAASSGPADESRSKKSRKGKKSKKSSKRSDDKSKDKKKKKKSKKKKTSKEGDDCTAEMSRQATENPDWPEAYAPEELDLRRPVHTLDHYIDDKKEMLRHVFSTIRPAQLQAILPPSLKELDEEQLKRLCLEQLEQLSDATILRIISGHDDDDWPVTMESSCSPSAQLTDAARDRNDNNKEEESSGKTLMELLELEMRARAIKALLKRQEADDEAAQHLSTRDNRISSSSSSGSSSGDASSSSRSSSPNGGQNPAVRGGLDTPHGDGGHKSAANPAVKRTADDQDHPPAEKPNQQVELPAADSPPAQHQVDEEFGILDVDIELGVDDDL